LKKFISAAVCTAMLFCLAGCEQKKSETETEFEPAPAFTPLTEIKEGRKNIYLIIKTLNSDYWNVVVDGAKAGGDDFDCNIYYSGSYIESDWESQSRLMEEAAEAGADAVLLAPNDSVKLSADIEKVYSKGIKLVLVDTIAITDSYDVCFMTDNLMAGQLASAEMLDQLHEKGYTDNETVQVGVQVCATATQTINERLAGFLQYWSNHAPDNWTVISDIKFNEGDIERGCECTRDLLNNYPDIKGVFGSDNVSTTSLAATIKEKERKDIVVVGFDHSPEISELIYSEDYTASSVLQKQFDMSYEGVRAALELIDGKEAEQKFVDTGITVVNSNNLNDPEVRETLDHNRG
jgi:ribose transport system substrate-binding protein